MTSVVDSSSRFSGDLGNVLFTGDFFLVRGTTNSELERTRGIRLFN